MKKVLIVGQGHLGSYIYHNLPDCLAQITDKRLDDPKLVFELADYDILINTAAKTRLEWCEEFAEEAFKTNVRDAVELAKYCLSLETKFIQLSSGCVWNGPFNPNGDPFEPEDTPTPSSHYAVTKAYCDQELMALKSNNVAILRLRMPYSYVDSNRNLFNKLLAYDDLIDTPNTITSADTLVKAITNLLNDNSPLWGRVSLVYDYAVTSAYRIAMKLYKAGLRKQPGRLDKETLDSFHRPKRVDTVMYDPVFEAAVDPPEVGKELDRVLALWIKNREVA